MTYLFEKKGNSCLQVDISLSWASAAFRIWFVNKLFFNKTHKPSHQIGHRRVFSQIFMLPNCETLERKKELLFHINDKKQKEFRKKSVYTKKQKKLNENCLKRSERKFDANSFYCLYEYNTKLKGKEIDSECYQCKFSERNVSLQLLFSDLSFLFYRLFIPHWIFSMINT